MSVCVCLCLCVFCFQGGQGDALQVQGHAFFKGLNWTDVLKRRYVPPIQPCGPDSSATTGATSGAGPVVSGGGSAENFEREFTGLDVSKIFEVTDPLSPNSNAIFANFDVEPSIRLYHPTPRGDSERGSDKASEAVQCRRPSGTKAQPSSGTHMMPAA